jgi:hypothetical protein
LERSQREGFAAIADSFNTTVTALDQAIASLLVVQTAAAGTPGPAVTTTSTALASTTFTVPTGYTKALVQANAAIMAYNNNAVGDYLYCLASIDVGGYGGETYTYAGPSLATSTTAPYYEQLTGLAAGSSFVVSVKARTSAYTWAADASNSALIYASVIFQR